MRGKRTMALVPQVVDAVAPVPVMRPGSLTQQESRLRWRWAVGVWVGTRFLAAMEANICIRSTATSRLTAAGDDTLLL